MGIDGFLLFRGVAECLAVLLVWGVCFQPTIAARTADSSPISAFYFQGAGATPTATATPTHPPDIEVAPTTLNELHTNAPQVTTQTLTIRNIGASELLWAIAEQENRPIAASPH